MSHPLEQGEYSFGLALTRLAQLEPEATALICDAESGEERLTRRQLESRSNNAARYLLEHGVGAGDYVSLLLPNGADFFVLCFAAWKVGAIPNPLSPRLPQQECEVVLSRAQPRLVIGLTERRSSWPSQTLPLAADHLSDAPLSDTTAPRERALASGGSTGVPKLIVAANAATYNTEHASPLFRAKKAVLIPGPLYHGAPFSAAFQGLLCGCALVVMQRFDAERCLQLIAAHQVDRVTLVPTMMQRIWKLPESVREQYDVSSLEFVLTGSAPCPRWVMQAWIDWLGPDVMHEAFGPSERIGGTFITGREWLQRPGSVGRPSAGAQLKILDEAGNELPAGEMGEIYVMPAGGTGSTFEYVGAEPKLTEDGWQSVGDLGYFDEDGYLYLGDRRSDLILRAGSNVYPAEVEAAIDAFDGVRSSAVIGLPDDDLGESVHAIVDTGEGGNSINEQALREFLSERLIAYKLPKTFEWVSEPLRDDAGKVRRSALRAQRLTAVSKNEA